MACFKNSSIALLASSPTPPASSRQPRRAIIVTRILAACLHAQPLESARTANLVAEYCTPPGKTLKPATEAVLTKCPTSALNTGSAALMP